MVAVQDFFLPGYARQALERAGACSVEDCEIVPGTMGRHLRVDSRMVHLLGTTLRRRAAESPRLSVRPEAIAEELASLRGVLQGFAARGSPLRRDMLALLPAVTGFPAEMIAVMLSSLEALLAGGTEAAPALPTNAAALGLAPRGRGYVRFFPGAFGFSLFGILARIGLARSSIPVLPLTGLPRVVSSVAAGNVPGIALMQSVYALAAGAASLVKNSSAEPCFAPAVLEQARSLEVERGLFPLTDFIIVLTFTRNDRGALAALVAQGDHLQVTGGLDSRREISRMVAGMRLRGGRHLRRRVTGNWHKVSFDLVARELLGSPDEETVAHGVAVDNSMFNTQGCLSAQQVFVEGTQEQALAFARRLVTGMTEVARRLPKGTEPLAGLREMYTHYEGKPDVVIMTRLGEMAAQPFFVACDLSPREFAVFNALNRSVLVRRLRDMDHLAAMLRAVPDRDVFQSCGVAVGRSRLAEVAAILGRAGVTRIVSVGDIWNMRPDLDSWDGNLKPLDLIAPKSGYWTTVRSRDPDTELREVHQRNYRLLAEVAHS